MDNIHKKLARMKKGICIAEGCGQPAPTLANGRSAVFCVSQDCPALDSQGRRRDAGDI